MKGQGLSPGGPESSLSTVSDDMPLRATVWDLSIRKACIDLLVFLLYHSDPVCV